MGPISFPGLGLKFFIDPIVLQIGPLSIHWYGIIISSGFLLAVLLAMRNSTRFGIDPENIIDMVLVAAPVAIICARLYYVIFTWELYKANPIDIIKIWEGGIAIYGAIIGAVIAAYLFARKRKIPYRRLFDLCAPYLALAQAIGRWGNFVNQEAYGGPTNLPWRMEILDEMMNPISVHPTFLYESLWNIMNFAVLIWYRKYKRKADGDIFLLYVFIYGLGRAWIEGLRTDSLMLGNLRVSQGLAILLVLICGFLFFRLRSKPPVEVSENAKDESTLNENGVKDDKSC